MQGWSKACRRRLTLKPYPRQCNLPQRAGCIDCHEGARHYLQEQPKPMCRSQSKSTSLELQPPTMHASALSRPSMH